MQLYTLHVWHTTNAIYWFSVKKLSTKWHICLQNKIICCHMNCEKRRSNGVTPLALLVIRNKRQLLDRITTKRSSLIYKNCHIVLVFSQGPLNFSCALISSPRNFWKLIQSHWKVWLKCDLSFEAVEVFVFYFSIFEREETFFSVKTKQNSKHGLASSANVQRQPKHRVS